MSLLAIMLEYKKKLHRYQQLYIMNIISLRAILFKYKKMLYR